MFLIVCIDLIRRVRHADYPRFLLLRLDLHVPLRLRLCRCTYARRMGQELGVLLWAKGIFASHPAVHRKALSSVFLFSRDVIVNGICYKLSSDKMIRIVISMPLLKKTRRIDRPVGVSRWRLFVRCSAAIQGMSAFLSENGSDANDLVY